MTVVKVYYLLLGEATSISRMRLWACWIDLVYFPKSQVKSNDYLVVLMNVSWLSLKKSSKHAMLIMFTVDDGKYKAFSSVIFNAVPLSSGIWVITVPIPSGSKSEPPIVVTHLSEHGIMSLNRDFSLTMWTLAALLTTNVMDRMLNFCLWIRFPIDDLELKAVVIVK